MTRPSRAQPPACSTNRISVSTAELPGTSKQCGAAGVVATLCVSDVIGVPCITCMELGIWQIDAAQL